MARNVPLDTETETLMWNWIARAVTEKLSGTTTPDMSPLPTWDPALDCRVQLNPALLPLSGKEPQRIAEFLRNVAQTIEEGQWNTYLFILQKGR